MSEGYGLTAEQRRKAIETASQVAHVAAAGVFRAQVLTGSAPEPGDDGSLAAEFWFNDGRTYTVPGAAAPVDDLAASDALAEFQFDVPPNGETLYRQARYLQLHDLDRDAFAGQPARIRIAFEIFARTAVAVFEAIAAEARRAEPEVVIGAVNLSPQMLEKIGDDSEDRELQDPHRVAAIRAAHEVPPAPKKKRGRKPKAETQTGETQNGDTAPAPAADTPPADPAADGEGDEGDELEDGDETPAGDAPADTTGEAGA